ncbi:MAG: TetR/AcrR family transcriptional regulator [Erythrobacter sp.]
MAKQKDRSASTRAMLLAAFRKSLLLRGFEATTTQIVLDDIGLSKGAMYHHFRSKNDLMEAVYVEESQSVIARSFGEIDEERPALSQLKAGCLAWLEEIRPPSVSRILFEIGPAALGQERARRIENSHGIARIRALLDQATTDGAARFENTQLTASFINSLVSEAALHQLKAGESAGEDLSAAIDALLAVGETHRGGELEEVVRRPKK